MAKTHRQSPDYNSTVTRNETLKQWTTFKKALERYDEDVLRGRLDDVEAGALALQPG